MSSVLDSVNRRSVYLDPDSQFFVDCELRRTNREDYAGRQLDEFDQIAWYESQGEEFFESSRIFGVDGVDSAAFTPAEFCQSSHVQFCFCALRENGFKNESRFESQRGFVKGSGLS